MSNGLDSDQDRCYVGPDLGPNCFRRLSSSNHLLLSLARTRVFLSYQLNKGVCSFVQSDEGLGYLYICNHFM